MKMKSEEFKYKLPHHNSKLPYVLNISKLISHIPIDSQRILQDVNDAEKFHPFTRKTPGWHSIPLRSANGDTGEAGSRSFGIHNSGDVEVYKDTSIMNHTPYIKELLDNLGGKYLKIRIMRVLPNQAIAEHIDNFQDDDIIRVHIPIITHPLVEFWVEKEKFYIECDKLSYINVRRRHKVINKSKYTRVHLVIDIKWDDEFGKRFYESLE